MSADYSYRCRTHEPPIFSDSINGHGGGGWAFDTLAELWANRELINHLRGLTNIDVSISGTYTSSNLNYFAQWVENHRSCVVDVVDDYGNEYPLVKVVHVDQRQTP